MIFSPDTLYGRVAGCTGKPYETQVSPTKWAKVVPVTIEIPTASTIINQDGIEKPRYQAKKVVAFCSDVCPICLLGLCQNGHGNAEITS